MKSLSSISQKITAKATGLIAAVFVMAMGTLVPLQPASAELNSMLAPTSFTPSSYQPPNYDAFDHDYYRPPVAANSGADSGLLPDTAPDAEFMIMNNQTGLESSDQGTTKTVFTFDASSSSDNETDQTRLEVRWDFNDDGQVESYFSTTKSIQHTFTVAGIYNVKAEILDTAGNISSIVHSVTIVENTPPTAYFTANPVSGTAGKIFSFDSSRSRDDQYLPSSLQYRFDWNGDGKWDTTYQTKTTWFHRFGDAGANNVIMEAKDPEGATSKYSQGVETTTNTAPVANFAIKSIPDTQGAGYAFDASSSSDAETSKQNLLYRWDFNYNGPNDIVYDTSWSGSPMYNGYYSVPGQKGIKLEVKDEDGAISTAYAQIYVSWTDVMTKKFMNGLR